MCSHSLILFPFNSVAIVFDCKRISHQLTPTIPSLYCVDVSDYHDLDFTVSHWGTNYPRLLELKRRYDPQGLFYGHHAVGSELWSPDGNCRVGA